MLFLRLAASFALVLSLCAFAPAARAQTTGSMGSGAPIDNRQASIELNYLICNEGTFPSIERPINRSETAIVGEIRPFAGDFVPAGWLPCDGRLLPIPGNEVLFVIIGTLYGGDGWNNFALPDLRGRVPVGNGPGLPLGTQVGVASITLAQQHMPAHSHGLGAGSSTGSTGGSQSFDNRQPGLALHHLIFTSHVPYNELGEIMIFAGGVIPTGNTALCQGQVLTIASNPELFSRLGHSYGGDGINTFALPDLRGRVVVGISSSFNSWVGETLGADSTTLGESQLPTHAHTLDGPLPTSTGVKGSSGAVNNLQSSLVMHYYLSADGAYPGGGIASGPMIGDVRIYASLMGMGIPSYLRRLDGSSLSSSENASLAALLQTRYGTEGPGTFALPDARERVVVGAADPASPGQTYGTNSFTLTVAQLPAHSHSVPARIATTEAATVLDTWNVILAATVNLGGVYTEIYFDYGPSSDYGQSVYIGAFSNGGNTSVSGELHGLQAGATYHYRVRAVSAGGTSIGSDVTFTMHSHLEVWRLASFGTMANTGAAADLATPLDDGVPNLLKFAIGVAGNQRATPPGTLAIAGSNFEFVYPRSPIAVAHGISFTVEWSDTLKPNSWSSSGVTETVSWDPFYVQTVKATVPRGDSERRFVRLRVTPP